MAPFPCQFNGHLRTLARTCPTRCILCQARSRRRSIVATSCHARSRSQPGLPAELLWKQCLATFTSGAVLGPLCDGQHSAHNVLHYASPTLLHIDVVHVQLETCWWVPVLFGVAGVILGVGHPLADEFYDRVVPATTQSQAPADSRVPGWGLVYLGIALFVLQYAASGALEEPLLPRHLLGLPALDVVLAATAVAHWAYFDRSPQGVFWACLTALAGPAVEIILINWLQLYHYSHPAVAGVPTWIPWVYFCGAPAVGNLGRQIRQDLLQGSARACKEH